MLVVPLQVQNAAVMEHAARAREGARRRPGSTSVDDRDQRPGVKFKDADLIGIPLRVVVGERGLKDGKIEIKWRQRGRGEARPGGIGGRERSSPSSPRRASDTRSRARERLQARAAAKGA